jgi:hypothetical protein
MSPRELEEAVRNLEKVARAGDRPSHYVARHVLLALGAALSERGEEASAPWVGRIRAAGELAGEGWHSAVDHELSLACGEFAQCLDPRYLGLPNYDLDYTRAARSRLEDRLRAARALGVAPSPKDSEVLALADRVLATVTERRGPPEAREAGPDPGSRTSHK